MNELPSGPGVWIRQFHCPQEFWLIENTPTNQSVAGGRRVITGCRLGEFVPYPALPRGGWQRVTLPGVVQAAQDAELANEALAILRELARIHLEYVAHYGVFGEKIHWSLLERVSKATGIELMPRTDAAAPRAREILATMPPRKDGE